MAMNTMTRTASHTRGFTLIEVMLYIALAASVIYVVSLLYSVVTENHAANDTRASVNAAAADGMRQILDAIRRAESVDSPGLQATSDMLILNMNDPAVHPTVFTVNDGMIEMQEGANDPVQITAPNVSISNLEFANGSETDFSDTIRFSFAAEYRWNSGRLETSFLNTYYGSATTK
jgi:type II secretory pathway pseudopilin PulG